MAKGHGLRRHGLEAEVALRANLEDSTACDEKAVREMEKEARQAYSKALLNCSVQRRRIAVGPLAFGEAGVKARIKNVMRYRRPAVWIVAAAVILCAVLAVCFLTNPTNREPDLSFLNYENAISTTADMEAVRVIYCPSAESDEESAIFPGAANGPALARYLDSVSWRKRTAPQGNLSSPGSIEFCIREDWRITVYRDHRWAEVRLGDDVRFYKTGPGDYDEAVRLMANPHGMKQEID